MEELEHLRDWIDGHEQTADANEDSSTGNWRKDRPITPLQRA